MRTRLWGRDDEAGVEGVSEASAAAGVDGLMARVGADERRESGVLASAGMLTTDSSFCFRFLLGGPAPSFAAVDAAEYMSRVAKGSLFTNSNIKKNCVSNQSLQGGDPGTAYAARKTHHDGLKSSKLRD